MCGRYSLTFIFEDLAEVFNAIVDSLAIPPRYNVAPTQEMPVITRQNGQNHLSLMRWGLVPYWAKDPSIGSRMINARRETLTEKPAFKAALTSRRCLIPADGYYEWQQFPGQRSKQPYRIVVPDRSVFSFAGLWESWGNEQAKLNTFTIVTTEAGPEVAGIHDRMPLILPRNTEEMWLRGPQPGQTVGDFLDEIKPEHNLQAYPVSTLVNSPHHDFPDCMVPLNQLF